MNLKNCKVIYLKSQQQELQRLVPQLRGRIVVSDEEGPILDQCKIYGIIHVFNTNKQRIPDSVDCIICTQKMSDLENKITMTRLGIPIVYYNMQQKWCGICGKLSVLDVVNRYCSEACMKRMVGFSMDNTANAIKDLNEHRRAFIKFDKSSSSNNNESLTKQDKQEKFQTSMVKEAQRIIFAHKKESYKKEMRQPAHRKTNIIEKKTSSSTNISDSVKYCKSMTKNGTKQCGNRALEGSDYCGISAHRSSVDN